MVAMMSHELSVHAAKFPGSCSPPPAAATAAASPAGDLNRPPPGAMLLRTASATVPPILFMSAEQSTRSDTNRSRFNDDRSGNSGGN